MKIHIISSKSFYDRFPSKKLSLEKLGHEVTLPHTADTPDIELEAWNNGIKAHARLVRECFEDSEEKIANTDAVIYNMDSKKKRNSVKEDYNLIAAQYAKDFGNSIEDLDVYEAFEKELPKGAIILDLGAGTGRTYAYFNKRGYDYIGLDFSPKMKDEAFRIHGKFPYILDDMINVKSHFDSNSVDAVFAVYSLFHLPKDDLREVLSDIYDILKTNGVIVLSYQLGAGEEFADEPYLGENGRKMLYMSYQTNKEMESILGSIGFADIYKKEKIEADNKAINSNDIVTVFRIMRKI